MNYGGVVNQWPASYVTISAVVELSALRTLAIRRSLCGLKSSPLATGLFSRLCVPLLCDWFAHPRAHTHLQANTSHQCQCATARSIPSIGELAPRQNGSPAAHQSFRHQLASCCSQPADIKHFGAIRTRTTNQSARKPPFILIATCVIASTTHSLLSNRTTLVQAIWLVLLSQR